MMPFASALPEGFSVDDNELVRIEALIQSMTPDERRNPALVGNQVTRQRRIAKGSGRKLEEVTDLVQRFNMMKQVMGALSGNTGGFLSQIPGFKQLSALKNLKNLDMGSLLGGMGGKGPGGFPVMGGFPGMGGGGMPNMASLEQMFAGMQQPQQPQQPKLPKGFNMPGVRAVSEAEANRGNAEFEREKRRKLAAKLAKKKNR
jgi:signal recognition particle subunit SRP54